MEIENSKITGEMMSLKEPQKFPGSSARPIKIPSEPLNAAKITAYTVDKFNDAMEAVIVYQFIFASVARVYQTVGYLTKNNNISFKGDQLLFLANNPEYLLPWKEKEFNEIFYPTTSSSIPLDTTIEADKLIVSPSMMHSE